MTCTTEDLIFTVPLTSKAHQLAGQFCKQQTAPQKAKQIYLNILAVYAVNFYLQCMEIETDWEASDSWNPVKLTRMNVADLQVKNRGKLECCPVLPKSQIVHIPPEAWSNRIGYVAVQMSESLREATLIKFTTTVSTHDSLISNWQSLEDLFECLSQPEFIDIAIKTPIKLGQWFQNIVDGWQTVEVVLDTLLTQETLAYSYGSANRFREISPSTPNAIPTLVELLQTSRDKLTRLRVAELLSHIASGNKDAITALTELLHTTQDDDIRRQVAITLGKIDSNHSAVGVRRAQVIDLGMLLNGHRVVLVVTLVLEADQRTNIHLRVYPISGQTYLPPNLKMTVLDESSEAFLEAQSRSADNWIQLELSGDSGDTFRVKVALGETNWQEDFVI